MRTGHAVAFAVSQPRSMMMQPGFSQKFENLYSTCTGSEEEVRSKTPAIEKHAISPTKYCIHVDFVRYLVIKYLTSIHVKLSPYKSLNNVNNYYLLSYIIF